MSVKGVKKKWNTSQSAFMEMAVPELNTWTTLPYVITVAHIDPSVWTLHADIHYWRTDWLQEEDKREEYRSWEGRGQCSQEEKKERG